MNAIVFFVIAFAIILGGFSLIMYLKFKDRLSNSVTFAEMEKCEDEIEKNTLNMLKGIASRSKMGSWMQLILMR